MYQIEVSPRLTKIFMDKQMYLDYKDYMENGLKVVSQRERTTRFNDCAQLIDVSYPNESPKRYVLHKDGKTFTHERYIKKYRDLAEEV